MNFGGSFRSRLVNLNSSIILSSSIWIYWIGISFLVFLLTTASLMYYEALYAPSSFFQDVTTNQLSSNEYAYVTLLCDDVMAKATITLVYSLKLTGTNNDIVVLVSPKVSEKTRFDLGTLGARVILIVKFVKYPFPITEQRLAINKPCRQFFLIFCTILFFSHSYLRLYFLLITAFPKSLTFVQIFKAAHLEPFGILKIGILGQ